MGLGGGDETATAELVFTLETLGFPDSTTFCIGFFRCADEHLVMLPSVELTIGRATEGSVD